MNTFQIKQRYLYTVYGLATIPVFFFCMVALAVIVPLSDYLRFVFGIVGFISAISGAVFLFVLFFRFLKTFRSLQRSNPISIVIDEGILRGYQTDYNEVFDPRKPMTINLGKAECRLPETGSSMKKLRISEGNKIIAFYSSMKFVKGSFDDLLREVSRYAKIS